MPVFIPLNGGKVKKISKKATKKTFLEEKISGFSATKGTKKPTKKAAKKTKKY